MAEQALDNQDRVLRTLCDDLMGLVGEQFFAALTTKLAEVAGADYAFIGVFTDETQEYVQTVAVYADGQNIDNLEFELKNTPCDVVVKKGLQRYPQNILKLFPLDHLAIELKVESYIGLPLIDSKGQVLGPLAVFSRQPLKDIELAETALHMIALRASAELERIKIERQRQEELHFLQSLLDAIPNPVFYKDTDRRYLGCNKSYEQLLDCSRQDLIGHRSSEMMEPMRAVVAIREDEKVFGSALPSTYEHTIRGGDEEQLQVLFNKAPFFDRQGELAGLVGTIQDISALRDMQSAMQSLVESTVGYTGSDCYRRVAQQLCQWFDADCAIVGRLEEDGKVLSLATLQDGMLIPEYCFSIVNTPCEQVVDDGVCLFSEGVSEHYPHSALVVQLQAEGYVGSPVRGHDGRVIGVLSVLSRSKIKSLERAKDVLAIMAARVSAEIEREQSEQLLRDNEDHLEYLVYHDVLTELPNRQLFRDRLQHAISMARLNHDQVAVLFLDLDRFKKINDSLGHEIGDRLLCEVARRLRNCVGDVDTVARLSGDEFAIIVDQFNSIENVILVAQQVNRMVAEVMEVEGYKLFLTASIGISLYPQDGKDVVSLLKSADAAMYNAKELGRDNYRFYTAGLNERASELLMLEGALRQAVEHNHLVVYYQPQIDLQTNQIIGAEALLRWQHPDQGMIAPADFIPMAEETGLIVSMGEWVLHQACSQNKAWQDAGYPPIRIAVNMSARQFRQKDLVPMVRRVLAETGLDACYLDLEITESILMNDVDGAIERLMELNDLGVRLSIDDFGTGYSSLAYLKQFPIHYLKIDQSFVRDVMTDPNDAAIATTIIDLARNMNLKVVAEGIEQEDQRQFLQQRGCGYGQGYLFSRPTDSASFEALLK
ncbi:MAG: EAL domain-containing protein [Desulfuromonas sp.]|nr:EAL domain-containing protein [Desulfuromonas sp.]